MLYLSDQCKKVRLQTRPDVVNANLKPLSLQGLVTIQIHIHSVAINKGFVRWLRS